MLLFELDLLQKADEADDHWHTLCGLHILHAPHPISGANGATSECFKKPEMACNHVTFPKTANRV